MTQSPPTTPQADEIFTIAPLVWLPLNEGQDWFMAQGCGGYQVERVSGSGWQWKYCWDEYYDDEDSHSADSLEDAKAEAENHYRERIMEFLIPAQPRAVEKVEGLEENDPNTLIKALRFFSEFVRLDDRTQPYFVRQEEKHHLMALIKAARIVAAQQKKAGATDADI